MAKTQEPDAISKRHDTDLWREIRKLYESKTKPTYDKIKAILVAEFQLEKFPSKSTVERRVKDEGWKRARVGTDPLSNRFDETFWKCVKTIYESNPKLSYKQLRDMVQNELQCSEFPSAQAITAKAKREDWKYLNNLVKIADTDLKKIKTIVKNQIIQDREDDGEDDENYDEDQEFNIFTDPKAIKARKIAEFEKDKLKNLTMAANDKRQKLADVILISRKRMRTMNYVGDMFSDRLLELYVMQNSDAFKEVCPPELMDQISRDQKKLSGLLAAYNELSFNRRESIKFELSLYGVQMDDLRDADNEGRIKNLEDNSAYEAQRQRLRDEEKEIAERIARIESGALEHEINERIQKQMDEMNEEEEIIEAEFQEME